MPHALPRPPPRARRAPLATSAFAALDDAHIDALLKAAEELAAVTSESNGDAHGAAQNPATTSPAARDALRAAITQRAQLVTLRDNVRALERQWLEAATAEPGETPLRLRRMERRRRELDAQLDAQRTRVRAACNDALAKFDAWWMNETNGTNETSETLAKRDEYERQRTLARRESARWKLLLQGEHAPSVYVSVALALLVPSVSVALWRHTFDTTLTPFVAQLRAGYAVLAPVVVAIGVPLLGSMLREPIKNALRRRAVGLTLVALSLATAAFVLWNAALMQRVRFRCIGVDLDASKLTATVDGVVQPLCAEGEHWVHPASSVVVRASGFRDFYAPRVDAIRVTPSRTGETLRTIALSPIRRTFSTTKTADNHWTVTFHYATVTASVVHLDVAADASINGRTWRLQLVANDCNAQVEQHQRTDTTRTVDFPTGCFLTDDTRRFTVEIEGDPVERFPFQLFCEGNDVESGP